MIIIFFFFLIKRKCGKEGRIRKNEPQIIIFVGRGIHKQIKNSL